MHSGSYMCCEDRSHGRMAAMVTPEQAQYLSNLIYLIYLSISAAIRRSGEKYNSVIIIIISVIGTKCASHLFHLEGAFYPAFPAVSVRCPIVFVNMLIDLV